MKKQKRRGFIDYKFDSANRILITKWNDTEAVSVATNYSLVFLTVSARRYSQKRKACESRYAEMHFGI